MAELTPLALHSSGRSILCFSIRFKINCATFKLDGRGNMKEPSFCEYCGHEFYKYESSDQLCCSNSCSAMLRSETSQQENVDIIPVDHYFRGNYKHSDTPCNNETSAIDRVLSMEDYDAIYGMDDGDSVLFIDRYPAYREMNKKSNKLIILSECLHNVPYKKHRHHPDYAKPLEVEILCTQCHHERHKSTNPFNQFSETKRQRMQKNISYTRSLAVSAAPNSSIPADQSIAQNSLGQVAVQ